MKAEAIVSTYFLVRRNEFDLHVTCSAVYSYNAFCAATLCDFINTWRYLRHWYKYLNTNAEAINSNYDLEKILITFFVYAGKQL